MRDASASFKARNSKGGGGRITVHARYAGTGLRRHAARRQCAAACHAWPAGPGHVATLARWPGPPGPAQSQPHACSRPDPRGPRAREPARRGGAVTASVTSRISCSGFTNPARLGGCGTAQPARQLRQDASASWASASELGRTGNEALRSAVCLSRICAACPFALPGPCAQAHAARMTEALRAIGCSAVEPGPEARRPCDAG